MVVSVASSIRDGGTRRRLRSVRGAVNFTLLLRFFRVLRSSSSEAVGQGGGGRGGKGERRAQEASTSSGRERRRSFEFARLARGSIYLARDLDLGDRSRSRKGGGTFSQTGEDQRRSTLGGARTTTARIVVDELGRENSQSVGERGRRSYCVTRYCARNLSQLIIRQGIIKRRESVVGERSRGRTKREPRIATKRGEAEAAKNKGRIEKKEKGREACAFLLLVSFYDVTWRSSLLAK